MLDDRVTGEERQEDKVMVGVKEGELILFDRRVFKWERTEGRRWRSRVSYNHQVWTSYISVPAQQSTSLL